MSDLSLYTVVYYTKRKKSSTFGFKMSENCISAVLFASILTKYFKCGIGQAPLNVNDLESRCHSYKLIDSLMSYLSNTNTSMSAPPTVM